MTTLADLRQSAQWKADKVDTDPNSFIPLAQWNYDINQSIGDLYEKVTNTNQDYNITQEVFQVGSGDGYNTLNLLTIPDFWKPRKVDVFVQGFTQDPWKRLKKIPLDEKQKYTNTLVAPLLQQPQIFGYCVYGAHLEILPPASASGTYRLWYIPKAPTLVNDTDSIDGVWLSVNGWDEYVALDVAIKALQREESDVSTLMMQKTERLASIVRSASSRDAGEPQKIIDVTGDRYGYNDPNDHNGGWW